MSRLRMGVVGVGALGRHHARILSECEQAELVAVVDSHEARGREVAQRCRTNWLADYRDLFRRVDAVSIVVPTVAHLSVAREFLERGIPVLVEKPLAANVSEAETLVQLAERHQTILQVGHVERFNPATVTAWQHCGAPKYVRAERLAPYSFRSTDIGVVHDLMIHDIDLVLSLVESRVRRVEAFGVGIMGSHEDAVQARIVFENGCLADLTASRINPTAARTMQIWSSAGCTTVDFHKREVVRYAPSDVLRYGPSPLERSRQPGADIEQLKAQVFGTFIQVESLPVPNGDALTAELTSFIDCVRNGSKPLVDGHAGLQAMLVADQVLEAVQQHGWDGLAIGRDRLAA